VLSSTTGFIFTSICLFYSVRLSISFCISFLVLSLTANFSSLCFLLIASSKACKLPSSALGFKETSIASFCFVSVCICFCIFCLSSSVIASFSFAYSLEISSSIFPKLPS
jgi:hypothetical protein